VLSNGDAAGSTSRRSEPYSAYDPLLNESNYSLAIIQESSCRRQYFSLSKSWFLLCTKQKLACISLYRQTPCPPRGTVPWTRGHPANPLVNPDGAHDTFPASIMPGDLTELEFSLIDGIDNLPLTRSRWIFRPCAAFWQWSKSSTNHE